MHDSQAAGRLSLHDVGHPPDHSAIASSTYPYIIASVIGHTSRWKPTLNHHLQCILLYAIYNEADLRKEGERT